MARYGAYFPCFSVNLLTTLTLMNRIVHLQTPQSVFLEAGSQACGLNPVHLELVPDLGGAPPKKTELVPGLSQFNLPTCITESSGGSRDTGRM
eukprot:5132942-Amphidinium_carterae.1